MKSKGPAGSPVALMSPEILQTLAQDFLQETGVEHCGLLLKAKERPSILSRVAFPGPHHAAHFLLCDHWLMEQSYAAHSLGRQVAGYYHTHPQGEALLPSLEDRRGHPFGALVVILGFAWESAGRRESTLGWRAFRVGEADVPWSVVDEGNLLVGAGF